MSCSQINWNTAENSDRGKDLCSLFCMLYVGSAGDKCFFLHIAEFLFYIHQCACMLGLQVNSEKTLQNKKQTKKTNLEAKNKTNKQNQPSRSKSLDPSVRSMWAESWIRRNFLALIVYQGQSQGDHQNRGHKSNISAYKFKVEPYFLKLWFKELLVQLGWKWDLQLLEIFLSQSWFMA